MADWLTTLSYVTPHYLIRSIYTNILMILCNFSEILSHVSRTSQCNLAEATALCMCVTITALRTLFFLSFLLILTYRGLSHLPSLANAIQTPSKVYRLRFPCARFTYRFIRLTYLMPRFDSYCMYHNTLDPLPIRLVVDRP